MSDSKDNGRKSKEESVLSGHILVQKQYEGYSGRKKRQDCMVCVGVLSRLCGWIDQIRSVYTLRRTQILSCT